MDFQALFLNIRKIEVICPVNMSTMSNSNTSMMVSSSEYSVNGTKQPEISHKPPSQLPLHPDRSSFQGPVAILWDIENCPVPSDVRSEDVGGNIRMALRVHPIINGAVTMFSAYGDFNAFPRRLREGCQRTGVKLIDVPNGRKDAADKAILVDMFLFALDNPPPSSIMLISGDVDFAPALHILGQRGYTVILVIPSGVGVSSALSNAGRFVWDWPSVARGEGFVPPGKALIPPRSGCDDVSGLLVGCQINDTMDGQNEEEAIVYRGTSRSYYGVRDFSVVSQSQSVHYGSSTLIPPNPSASHNGNTTLIPTNRTNSKSHNVSSCLKQAPSKPLASCEQNDLIWVQPGDLNGLKGQLVKLLELFGGILPLIRLPAEYQKIYGRPLYVSEYGAFKLVHILNKMSDAISVEGKGHGRHICLRTSKPGRVGGPIILARRDKKEKGPQQDTFDAAAGDGSSDEFSDEERVIFGVNHDREEGEEKLNTKMTDQSVTVSESLKKFKYELQEILVSYSCQIFLGCFEAIYEQKYKRGLDYASFGVNCLEQLLEKVRDVVALQEEPVNKKKYMVAVGG